ncbi:MAG: cysteine desulfurase [Candidatus Nomurabacteria bacterium]|jgi:cysteine desulfurase|nr:cysteine desulfurase [Candidatus Nomurabacteria bacterium]
MIYLDYAAATPVDKKVARAMQPFFAEQFFNPSASYGAAREVRAAYADAKHRLAQTIGARPAEVVLTAGATESINLAILGTATENPSANTVVTTAIEHAAVLRAARTVGAEILPVDERGRIDPDELYLAISDDTRLISVGYANNEIGTVQNIRQIAEIIQEIRAERAERDVRNPLWLHTDASQAAGLLDINVARLGVDLMSLNAGKCYGPKQVGLLYVRAGVEIRPLIHGGGQEMGLRSGTENVAGAVGFALALEIAEKKRKSEAKRLATLRDDLEKYITREFPEAIINGDRKQRLANFLNFSVPRLDAERAVFALDQRGVYLATGSACAANKGTRSHVLTAIGLSPELADGSLRISLGRGTTTAEISQLKPILKEVIKNEQKLS